MFILVLLQFTKTAFLFLFLAESVKILVQLCAGFPSADIFVVQTGIYVRDVFMKLKENGWAFYFKTPCKKYLDNKMTKTKDIIP